MTTDAEVRRFTVGGAHGFLYTEQRNEIVAISKRIVMLPRSSAHLGSTAREATFCIFERDAMMIAIR
jgi:hypothetical protein